MITSFFNVLFLKTKNRLKKDVNSLEENRENLKKLELLYKLIKVQKITCTNLTSLAGSLTLFSFLAKVSFVKIAASLVGIVSRLWST